MRKFKDKEKSIFINNTNRLFLIDKNKIIEADILVKVILT
jgi:hypothetical protein